MTRLKFKVIGQVKDGKEFFFVTVTNPIPEYVEEDVGSILKKSLASAGYPAGTLAELVEETNVPTPVWRI